MADETQGREVRVWCIGSDGTEYYAAHSEQEMREFYIYTVGAEEAARDFADYFEEVPAANLDSEFDFNDDGTKIRTTWRKLIADCHDLPAQISTGYV